MWYSCSTKCEPVNALIKHQLQISEHDLIPQSTIAQQVSQDTVGQIKLLYFTLYAMAMLLLGAGLYCL